MRLLLYPTIAMFLLIMTIVLMVTGNRVGAMVSLLLFFFMLYMAIQVHKKATLIVQKIVEGRKAEMEAAEKARDPRKKKKVVKKKEDELYEE